MDNRIEIRQDIYWNGDTMITEIVGKIDGDMAKKREDSVLNHFETDYTELREFLEAKRKGMEIAPVVRCKDCKHSAEDDWDGSLWCCRDKEREVVGEHFCSYGERKDNDSI